MRLSAKTALGFASIATIAFPAVSHGALVTYRNLVLADSPKVYLQLDETSGTTATDSGSNAINGTYGTTGVTLGQASASTGLGTSFANSVLDSTTVAPVTVNVGTGVNSPNSIGTGAFSVEFWFKSTTLDDRQDLMDMNGGTGSDFGIHLLGDSTTSPTVNRLRIFHNSDIVAATAATNITQNVWHHVVYTRTTAGSNNATLYYDGGVMATGTDTNTLTSTAPVLALAQKSTGTLNRAFVGNMDEFAFYGSALTSSQVSAHYLAGVPEPTTLSLAGIAAGGLLLRRRRVLAV